jgi:hypothetical protein
MSYLMIRSGLVQCNPRLGCRPCCRSRLGRRPCATNDEKGLGDELLDFMYAGKKLRKWYGEQDLVLPKDGGDPQGDWKGDSPEETVVRDKVAILFPEDSPMAEQVLLQLILLRASVLVVTKDVGQAKAGYGMYVDVVRGDTLPSSLKAAQSVVMCGSVSSKIVSLVKAADVPYVVLLSGTSSTAGQSMFSTMFASSETKELLNLSREEMVRNSGIPCTIVRVDPQKLSTLPGGSVVLTDSDQGGQNVLPREDVALYLAMRALEPCSDTGVVQLSSSESSTPSGSEEESRVDMVQKLLSAKK